MSETDPRLAAARPARSFWGRARLAAVVAFLILCVYTGFVEGGSGLRSAFTPGEKVTIAAQLAYGALALAALLSMLFRRDWVFPILVAWGLALTLTGTLAAIVFGGTSVTIGLAGGASVALIVGLVLWAWRCDLRAS